MNGSTMFGKEPWSSIVRATVAWLVGAAVAIGPSFSQSQPDCSQKSLAAASFNASCGATCPFTWHFQVTSPSGVSSVEWDFGDGAIVDGLGIQDHSYAPPGGYFTVTATIHTADNEVAVATGGVLAAATAPPDLVGDDYFETSTNTALPIEIDELLTNDAPGVMFDHADGCVLDASGQLCTYTPPSGFPAPSIVGTRSFHYWVKDIAGNAIPTPATVWVTVERQLVAGPDVFTTLRNTPLTITMEDLLANDSPGAVVKEIESEENLVHTCTEDDNHFPISCIFTPAEETFTGNATFQYLISWDGDPPYERGYVTVIVKDFPAAIFTHACGPTALHPQDSYLTCRTYPHSNGGVGGPARWLWNWGDGTPTVEPLEPYRWYEQVHTYAHSGRYTITHTVYDTIGQSDSAATEVWVTTPPVALDDSATTDRDVPVRIPVLANDSDPDGDSLVVWNVDLSHYPGANPVGGTCPPGEGICLVPPDSFVGTMIFPYTITDPWGATATATVTLTVNQWTNIVDALGEQLYTPQNVSLQIPIPFLLANDYAPPIGKPPQPNPLSIDVTSIDTSLLMGWFTCNSSSCTYQPPLNGAGFTLFRYKACDAGLHCDTATVRIYVAVHGQSPTAAPDFFSTTRNTPLAFTIQQLVANDCDADGDTLTVGMSNGARDYGSVACSTPMYTCTYTPNAGFVGTDRFAYTAWDLMNPAVSAFINVLTLPPATATFDAREDLRVTGANQQFYIPFSSLAANDYDPEGDPITVTAVDTTGLIGGSLTCDPAGCMFHPNSGFQGTSRFRYTASDGHGSTDVAIVKVRVGGTNTAPMVGPITLSTPKNMVRRFSVFELLANDYDADNDPLTPIVYPANTAKGSLACDARTYWCTYTPHTNVTGSDTFTFLVSDGVANVSSTLTINILP